MDRGGGGGGDRRSAALLILKSVLELQEGRENMAADEAEPGSMCLFSSVVLISFSSDFKHVYLFFVLWQVNF